MVKSVTLLVWFLKKNPEAFLMQEHFSPPFLNKEKYI